MEVVTTADLPTLRRDLFQKQDNARVPAVKACLEACFPSFITQATAAIQASAQDAVGSRYDRAFESVNKQIVEHKKDVQGRMASQAVRMEYQESCGSCRTHNRHALLLTSGSNRVSGRNLPSPRRAEDFHLPTQIRRMSAVDFVKGIKFIFFWIPSQINIANFASRNFRQAASSSHHVSQRSCAVEPSKAILAKTRTLRVWNPAVSCTFRRCVIPSANFSVSQP